MNWKRLWKSFAIWFAICWGNAAYSFFIALDMSYDVYGMILAVMLFVFGFTFISYQGFFDALKKRSIWKNAFNISFWIKTVYSVCPLVLFVFYYIPVNGMQRFLEKASVIFQADFMLGMLAAGIVESVGKSLERSFESGVYALSQNGPFVSFSITMVDGVLHNILIGLILLLLVFIQWAWIKARTKAR